MIFCAFNVTSSLPKACNFFFFNDTATTEIYTLSLHDALPISHEGREVVQRQRRRCGTGFSSGRARSHRRCCRAIRGCGWRSEEHTSELQSLRHLVCRLLLEKKKRNGTPEQRCRCACGFSWICL